MDIIALIVTLLLGLASGYWVRQVLEGRQRRKPKVKSVDEDDLPLPNFSERPRLEKKEGRRIIVVAKQLPVNATRHGGDWQLQWSDTRDFLANLRVLRSTGDVRWVGAPNIAVPRDLQVDFDALMEEQGCHPVYLTEDVKERFFTGFCKGVLWPLLHYVTPLQTVNTFAKNWDDLWSGYKTANMLYAREVGRVLESPDDIVWVHNYHLLLLPSLLRAKIPRIKIGVFIHTPFPSSDVFRVMPARESILRSIMCADMIGFHTFDYARHFLSCCKRILDLEFETMAGGTLGVKYQGRNVTIVISHVGIDSKGIADLAKAPGTLQRAEAIKKKHNGRRVLIGVDDLDLVKGSVLKLQAYDRFLSMKPQWKDKVVLLQILLPTSVQEHEKQQVGAAFMNEVAGLRSRHGPGCVDLVDAKDLDMSQLVASYLAADVAVVSTFWDGLNLVPLEYTAAQDSDNPGTLVLSEFMGCSRALSGVLRVNPWSLEQVAEAISTALETPLEERKANHARRYTYVMNHDATRWATGFVQRLEEASESGDELVYQQVGFGSTARTVGLRADFVHLEENIISAPYRQASLRILLLDYDGTLTAAHKNDTRKKLNAPTPRVKKLLRALCEDRRNLVFLIAGRERKQLAQWFGDIKELGLAAEKGCFLRWPASRAHLYRGTPLLRFSESLITSKPGKAGASWLAPSAITQGTPVAGQSLKPLTHSISTSALPSSTLPDALSPFPPLLPQHGGAHTMTSMEAKNLAEEFKQRVSGSSSSSSGHSNENEYIEAEWETMVQNTDDTWHAEALQIIKSYTEHTDGSWIEDKEFAIVWHYESADPEYGRMQASELVKYLLQVLPTGQVDVVKYESNRIIEVKPHGIGKGVTAAHILRCVLAVAALEEKTSTTVSGSSSPPPSASPFILCIGDDRSDEEMFKAVHRRDDLALQAQSADANDETVPRVGGARALVARERDERRAPNSFTACVGLKPSAAKYYVRDHEDVQKLLQHLVHCSERQKAPSPLP